MENSSYFSTPKPGCWPCNRKRCHVSERLPQLFTPSQSTYHLQLHHVMCPLTCIHRTQRDCIAKQFPIATHGSKDVTLKSSDAGPQHSLALWGIISVYVGTCNWMNLCPLEYVSSEFLCLNICCNVFTNSVLSLGTHTFIIPTKNHILSTTESDSQQGVT